MAPFEDAEPWHVIVANGSTRAEPGVATDPDLTWETSWGKWIALSKGAIDPKRAVLQRDLRFKGSLRELYRFTKAFPRRRAPVA
jgi:putative sterol carrier protein